jgi:hypothetical protein
MGKMNERLEAFRRRLHEQKKSSPKWHQQIGSPTAWLALIFSTTTFFNTFFYYSDEMSVVVTPRFLVNLLEKDKIMVEPPTSITFINSGSRPIAVLGVSMMIVQPTEKTARPDCRGNGNHWLSHLVFDQTVVKPYEMTTLSMKFYEAKSTSEVRYIPPSSSNLIPDQEK